MDHDEHGSVYALRTRSGERERLTTIASQYGSLALSADGKVLAYVRGTGGLQRGLWLSNETRFELVVRESGRERVVTTISGRELQYANFAAKIPPHVLFGPDRGRRLVHEAARSRTGSPADADAAALGAVR